MSANQAHPGSRQHRKIPWILKLFLIGTFLFGIVNIYKFIQVLLKFRELSGLELEISPLYLGVEGLLWGACGFFLAWSIWTGKSWTPSLGSALSLLYGGYFWIDRVFIAQPEIIARRWPVNLAFTILGLGLALGSLHRPASRTYFGKNPVKIP